MAFVDMRGESPSQLNVDYVQAAQAAVRAYCGWHVAPTLTETIYISQRHESDTCLLPSLRVLDIEAVEQLKPDQETWEPVTGYGWDEQGTLALTRHSSAHVFRHGLRNIRVTLTHGWDLEDVPDLAAIVESIAKRAATSPYGIASQSVNGASVSYQMAGGAPLSVPLLNIEKEQLAPYALGLGRIAG